MGIKEKIKEHRWWVIIGILALLAVIIFFASSCGGGGSGTNTGVSAAVKKVWEASSKSVPAATDVQQRTSEGVTVYSRNGLSPDHLAQVDEALRELFADVQAAYPDQAVPLAFDFGSYDIYEPEHDCIPSPVMRVPSFYVRDGGLQYDGSQYDQYNSKGPGVADGASVVLAPERVWGMTSPGSSTEGSPTPRAKFLICPDLANWRNSVRYGAEHNVSESAKEQNALLRLAAANRTHTTGGHPFIPFRSAGLTAVPRVDWSEFAPEIK